MKHEKRSQLFRYIYEFLKRIAVFFSAFLWLPKLCQLMLYAITLIYNNIHQLIKH